MREMETMDEIRKKAWVAGELEEMHNTGIRQPNRVHLRGGIFKAQTNSIHT